MSYFLGVLFAIGAGIAINIGTVLQKKVVNDVPAEKRDKDFMRTLLHNKLWLTGLLIQIGLGTTMTIIANIIIGPALLPGLLATGLIAMAIGAAKIVGEKLTKTEIIAIGLIIVAAILIALTNLSVDIATVDIMNSNFLFRQFLFTGILGTIIAICEISVRKIPKVSSIMYAIESGCYLALANYWVAPVTGHVMHLFNGTVQMPVELIIGIVGGIILALTNILAISQLQNSFKTGKANVCIPIQQVPVNIAPIFIYFGIFQKDAPNTYAIAFMLIAIILIIFCSYILAKRQIQLEEIK